VLAQVKARESLVIRSVHKYPTSHVALSNIDRLTARFAAGFEALTLGRNQSENLARNEALTTASGGHQANSRAGETAGDASRQRSYNRYFSDTYPLLARISETLVTNFRTSVRVLKMPRTMNFRTREREDQQMTRTDLPPRFRAPAVGLA
jgi:hypothetical protein